MATPKKKLTDSPLFQPKKSKLQQAAEQIREKSHSTQSHASQASIRDRMVKIGRGNQQAGRQKRGGGG